MSTDGVIAGVSDHAGWAVLVTVAEDATVLDSRRVELVAADLPGMPHHGPAQRLPIEEAVDLVERVRASAAVFARRVLDDLPTDVRGIAIRKRPTLPATVAERITSYWAQNRADWVMYRDVLAEAATARGWSVHEYDAKTVFTEAAEVLGLDEDVTAWLKEIGYDARHGQANHPKAASQRLGGGTAGCPGRSDCHCHAQWRAGRGAASVSAAAVRASVRHRRCGQAGSSSGCAAAAS